VVAHFPYDAPLLGAVALAVDAANSQAVPARRDSLDRDAPHRDTRHQDTPHPDTINQDTPHPDTINQDTPHPDTINTATLS
jgi:hypothetical protein